jgi:hypothetical protein
MGDIGGAIKYLYSQFILRDVLSFITPGAIVVLTTIFLFLPEPYLTQRVDTFFRYSREIHWLIYIPIFGIFYFVGFAMQCFGDIVGFVRFSPYIEKSLKKRWRMFLCSWDENYKKPEESNMWWWEAHEKWADFFEVIKEDTKYNDDIRQGRERLVVIKQMCSNAFIAIILSCILIPFALLSPWVSLGLLIAVLVISLFWGHRVHTLTQYTRERITTDRSNHLINKKV